MLSMLQAATGKVTMISCGHDRNYIVDVVIDDSFFGEIEAVVPAGYIIAVARNYF